MQTRDVRARSQVPNTHFCHQRPFGKHPKLRVEYRRGTGDAPGEQFSSWECLATGVLFLLILSTALEDIVPNPPVSLSPPLCGCYSLRIATQGESMRNGREPF